MALGNIVGSNIFNITLILGLSSQVMPLTSSGITYIDYIVMIAATVLLFVIGLFGRIGRLSGLLMFICFVLYNWYLVSNQMA
jgi:cation:H+ antiporter